MHQLSFSRLLVKRYLKMMHSHSMVRATFILLETVQCYISILRTNITSLPVLVETTSHDAVIQVGKKIEIMSYSVVCGWW